MKKFTDKEIIEKMNDLKFSKLDQSKFTSQLKKLFILKSNVLKYLMP